MTLDLIDFDVRLGFLISQMFLLVIAVFIIVLLSDIRSELRKKR